MIDVVKHLFQLILPLLEFILCILQFLGLVIDHGVGKKELLAEVGNVFLSQVQFFVEGLLVLFETLDLQIHVVYLDLDQLGLVLVALELHIYEVHLLLDLCLSLLIFGHLSVIILLLFEKDVLLLFDFFLKLQGLL